jgi:intracellular septation protein
MNIFFDFFPIILFFMAYKFYGIYAATAVAMVASAIQIGLCAWMHNKVEKSYLLSMICIMVMGGATLFLRNPIFIMWKPSIIYWALSFAFAASHYFGKQKLAERMLNERVILPEIIWTRINSAFVTFFFIMGTINLYVAYTYSENTWVNYKLFGTLGLTFVFILLLATYISKYGQENPSLNEPYSVEPEA